MSVQGESIEHEVDVKDLLLIIANNLILMNARLESAFETGIELEDIDHGGQ